MMRCVGLRICTAAFAALVAAETANAQFSATFTVEHTAVLQFEAIHAKVTVTNDTLYPVVVGAKAAGRDTVAMDLRVIKKDDESPSRLTKRVMANGLELAPGDGLTLDLDLTEWYDFHRVGRYMVSIVWTSAGKTHESSQEMIDVVDGIELKKITREVAFSDGETRQYSLRYWTRDRAEHVFLRVDNEEGSANYGVFELGEIVRVYDPILTVDRFGNVLVVHQVAMDQYRRSELKSVGDGVHFLRWSDVTGNGNPVGETDADGQGGAGTADSR